MSFGQVRWALGQLNDWTWLVVQYRVWLITLATATGGAAPLLSAARKHLPTPAPSLVVRSGALALALSATAVAICSLLHFSDLRWLAPDQRGSLYLSAPSGLLGFTRPVVVVLNSVAGLPAEWRAARASVHTAIVCALLVVAAFALAVLSRRRARRADIRQIVQEEIRKATGGNRLCDTRPGPAANCGSADDPRRRLRRLCHTVPVTRRGPFWDAIEGRAELPGAAVTLGFEIIAVDPDAGTIEVAFRATEGFVNLTGVVQGGFLAAMLDATLGPALTATLDPGEFAPTTDLHVQFVRPARPGRLVGRGRIIRRGRDVGFLAGELIDEQGIVVAVATATAQIRRSGPG